MAALTEDGDDGRLPAERQREFAAHALGDSWTVLEPLAGGHQQGALEVVNQRGDRGVFKLADPSDEVAVVAQKAVVIRQAISQGWPAAPWIAWGELESTTWFVQQLAEGEPLVSMSREVEDAILNAVDRQAGLGSLPHIDWSLHTSSVAAPGSYWHERCREFGGEAHELSKLLASACTTDSSPSPLSDDLVHGDFATDNILEHHGAITIIDTQSIGRGSRAVDLAAMATHCLAWDQAPESAPQFFDAALAVAGGEAMRFAAGRALGAIVFSMDHYPDFVPTMARRLLALEAFTDRR